MPTKVVVPTKANIPTLTPNVAAGEAGGGKVVRGGEGHAVALCLRGWGAVGG